MPEGLNNSPLGQSTKLGKPTQVNYKAKQPKIAKVTQIYGYTEYCKDSHKARHFRFLKAPKGTKGLNESPLDHKC